MVVVCPAHICINSFHNLLNKVSDKGQERSEARAKLERQKMRRKEDPMETTSINDCAPSKYYGPIFHFFSRSRPLPSKQARASFYHMLPRISFRKQAANLHLRFSSAKRSFAPICRAFFALAAMTILSMGSRQLVYRRYVKETMSC